MTLGHVRSQDLKRASALLLTLGAAFAFYFFHFVLARSEHLRERNLRELATLSRQIEAAFTKAQESRGSTQTCRDASNGAEGESHGTEPPWLQIEPRGTANSVHFSYPEKCFLLKEILQPIAWPDDLFDQFLLVEQESRRVLFRLTSPNIKIGTLELGDSNTLPRRSHYQKLEIGGRSYELFLQPVLLRSNQASIDRPTPPVTLALVGLVPSDSLRTEAGQLPSPLLVCLISLAVLLVLLLPFLKIGLQTAHERLRRLDLVQIAVASAFGLALAVILCLELWAHHALRNHIDASLSEISEDLSEDIQSGLKPMGSDTASDARDRADPVVLTELASMERPILPVDVSAAVIDASWRVLFHSDSRRNGQDDFLRACDYSRRLARKLLKSDPEDNPLLDLVYLGKPYQARVSRLGEHPLWLVVLHQKGAVQALHVDLMLWTFACLVLFLTALLSLVFLGGWIWALFTGRSDWILGSDERYLWGDLRLAVALGLLSLWAVNGLLLAPSQSRALLALAAPLTAIAFLISRLVWKRMRNGGSWIYATRILPLLVWAAFLATDVFWLAASLWPSFLLLAAVPLWLWRSKEDNHEISLSWLQNGGGVVLNTAFFFVVATVLPTGLLGSALWEYDYATLVWRDHEHLATAFHTKEWTGPKPWNLYQGALFGTAVRCNGACSPIDNKKAEHVGSSILSFLERFHERLPLSQQGLVALDEGASGWRVQRVDNSISTLVSNGTLCSSAKIGDENCHLMSPSRLDSGAWFGWHLLVALVGLSFFTMICITARHLLIVGLDPEDPRRSVPAMAADHLWWVAPEQKAKVSFRPDQEDVTWIDLDSEPGHKLLMGGRLPRVAPHTVLIPAVATLDEPKSIRLFLKLLERLVDSEKTALVIVATGLPEVEKLLDLAFPESSPASAMENEARNSNEHKDSSIEMSRENALKVLAHFTVLSYPEEIRGKKLPDLPETLPSAEDGSSKQKRLRDLLIREVGAHPQLRKIGGWLLKKPKIHTWRTSRFFDELGLAATFYYRWLWESCSETEKIALFQLAREHIANPRARDVLQGLLNKGLLSLQPHRGLRVFNQSFRRWIKRSGARESLAAKERQEGGWLDARRTILVVLLGLTCFVMTTQQEVFESLGSLKEVFVNVVTILTAIIGAIAGLGRFLNKPLLGADSE